MVIDGKTTGGGTYAESFEGDKMLLTIQRNIPFMPDKPFEVALSGFDQELYAT